MKTSFSIATSIRALVLAILMSAQGLIAYWISAGHSPAAFSDWDEPFYLPLISDAAQISFKEAFSWTNGTLNLYNLVADPIPHTLLDFILGKLVYVDGMSLLKFSLVLDLLCVFCAYLAGVRLFKKLGLSVISAETATIVTLCLPWLASLQNYFPEMRVAFFTTHTHQFYPCPPILRAVYTQISFVAYLLASCLLVDLLKSKAPSLKISLLLGIVSGLTIYLYFFAWATFTCLTMICLISVGLFYPQQLKFRFQQGLIFFSSQALVAAIGLSALFKSGKLYSPVAAKFQNSNVPGLDYSTIWYFSPLMLVALLFFVYCCLKFRDKSESRFLVCLLALACILSEFILVNIQPIVQRWLVPYHFSLFFLHPLFSGLMAALLIGFHWSKFQHLFTFILLTFALAITVSKSLYTYRLASKDKETIELLHFLAEELPPKSRLAIIPFTRPFDSQPGTVDYLLLPYWISAMTSTDVRSLFISLAPDREAYVKKELSLSWYFKGEISLIGSCSAGPLIESDMISGARFYNEYLRALDCELAPYLREKMNPCQILSEQPVEFLLWDRDDKLIRTPGIDSFSNVIWTSAEGRYTLQKVDLASALIKFCHETGT